MIRITVFKKSDSITGFSVSGHSGYADAGADIICSAVSTLVINTINSIEKFTDDRFKQKNDEGNALIEIHFQNELSHDGQLLVKSMIMGLEDVRVGSEKFMKITYKEE